MWLVPLALAVPYASQPRGWQDQPFALSFTTDTPGSSLLCAQDAGALAPCEEASWVEHSTQFHVVEIDSQGQPSPEVVFTYLFVSDALGDSVMDPSIVQHPSYGPELLDTIQDIPLVIITDPSEVTTEERQVFIEWIDQEGDTSALSGGARRVGYTSINMEKNSIRFAFRQEYGTSRWDTDLYGRTTTGLPAVTTFDALTLRGGNHDTVFYLGAQGQHLRNFWMDETQLEMGHIAPHGRFAHLFLNTHYEGLYHIRERFDAAMLGDYLDDQEEAFEAINAGSAYDGTGEAWNNAIAQVNDYTELKRWVEIDNFLDYMILNFYAANAWDWLPTHNWASAGPIQPDQGGFRFHSSDSDICLYYGPETNILSLEGPSYLFGNLRRANDPDFWVALADAIHRNLEDGGPLTAERSKARYQRLADMAASPLVAESARWGGGWWDRDGEWASERDRLLNEFFPARTQILLDQFRAAGWYPVDAPTWNLPAGSYPKQTSITVTAPEGADLFITLDGQDPRLPGGEPRGIPVSSPATFSLDHSMRISTRARVGESWGPISSHDYTTEDALSWVVNEWNAVAPDQEIEDTDLTFGVVAGNGGNWIELLLVGPGEKLVGMELKDLRGRQWVDLSALPDALEPGTLVMLTDQFPTDTSYNPAQGDTRIQLQVPIHVSSVYQQITLFTEPGTRIGPMGETSGVSDHETGALTGWPQAGKLVYQGLKTSSYGLLNPGQEEGFIFDIPDIVSDDSVAADPQDVAASSCQSGPGPLPLGLLALLLVACRRASPDTAHESEPESDVLPVDLDQDGVSSEADCDDKNPAVYPGASEVCGGGDEDCDGLVDDEDPSVADPLPWYHDADGDGVGGTLVYQCSPTELTGGGDCDDQNPAVYPGAPESCDGVDKNCDGIGASELGSAVSCAASSCRAIYEQNQSVLDGMYYVSGSAGGALVWCDMTRGGWTLGLVRSSLSTVSNLGFGATETGVASLQDAPEAASWVSAAGWLDLNTFSWDTLILAAYQQGTETYRSREIPRSDLRIPFGTDGYLLYGEGGYYWCGGSANFTDAGIGGVLPDGSMYQDCKGHGSLGSGWDFSESLAANAGLTLCGVDGSSFISASWGGSWTYYGQAGAAQAIWVR